MGESVATASAARQRALRKSSPAASRLLSVFAARLHAEQHRHDFVHRRRGEPILGVAPGSERGHRQQGAARQPAADVAQHVEQDVPLRRAHLEIHLDAAHAGHGAGIMEDRRARPGAQCRPSSRSGRLSSIWTWTSAVVGGRAVRSGKRRPRASRPSPPSSMKPVCTATSASSPAKRRSSGRSQAHRIRMGAADGPPDHRRPTARRKAEAAPSASIPPSSPALATLPAAAKSGRQSYRGFAQDITLLA